MDNVNPGFVHKDCYENATSPAEQTNEVPWENSNIHIHTYTRSMSKLLIICDDTVRRARLTAFRLWLTRRPTACTYCERRLCCSLVPISPVVPQQFDIAVAIELRKKLPIVNIICQFHGTPWSPMELRGSSRGRSWRPTAGPMGLHGAPWSFTGFHEAAMGLHGSPRQTTQNSMDAAEYHGRSRVPMANPVANFMEHHGTFHG